MIIQFKKLKCYLEFEHYRNNNNNSISLSEIGTGEPVAHASLNPSIKLADDEVCIKDYSENEGMYLTLFNAGVIGRQNRLVDGFPVCKLLVNKDMVVVTPAELQENDAYIKNAIRQFESGNDEDLIDPREEYNPEDDLDEGPEGYIQDDSDNTNDIDGYDNH